MSTVATGPLEDDREWGRNILPHLPHPAYRSREFLASELILHETEALLEEKRRDFLTTCRDLEKNISRQRAARSPVRRLPNEILSEIFSFIPNTFQARGLAQGARLVCRRWNSVAISSPRLWTNIVMEESAVRWPIATMMPIWLSRSSALPLNVVIKFFNGEPRSDAFWEQCKGFFSSLPRWATLTFLGHPLDFGRMFNEPSYPLPLEELSYRTEHNFFSWVDDEPYKYVDGRKVVFHTMRKLEISASSHSHPIRFIGHNLTTLSFKEVEIALQDYLAMSQDTPNTESLTVDLTTWHSSRDTYELLDAKAFGHHKLAELSWPLSVASPSLRYQFEGENMGGDLAVAIIFNCILSQGTGIHTLDISWVLLRQLEGRASTQLGSVKDLRITDLGGYSTDDLPAFRAWITQCRTLRKLEIDFQDSPSSSDTLLIRALYSDVAPNSSALTNPQIEKIDLRHSIIHVAALWGLHRACRSTIPLQDHFVDGKSEAIDWPREKNGSLLDLSEAANVLVDSKRLRFIVSQQCMDVI